MAIPTYLAMTAWEYSQASTLPQHPAWMACHFCDDGICNLPPQMPKGSLLILNDQLPPQAPNLANLQSTLCRTMEEGGFSALLLDFERKNHPVCGEIARALISLPFPVVVPADYAKGLSCPIFLPPVPPHMPPEEYLQPYRSREIWLELSLTANRIRVTREGSQILPWEAPDAPLPFFDETLCCHYRTEIGTDYADFCLKRGIDDLDLHLKKGKDYGIAATVGLWQEF